MESAGHFEQNWKFPTVVDVFLVALGGQLFKNAQQRLTTHPPISVLDSYTPLPSILKDRVLFHVNRIEYD